MSRLSRNKFVTEWMEIISPPLRLRNLRGDNWTVIEAHSDDMARYRRAKSVFRIRWDDLYNAYEEVCKSGAGGFSTSDLKNRWPSVFDPREGGHSCNATFLFQGLIKLGWVRIEGLGVRGAPFKAIAL